MSKYEPKAGDRVRITFETTLNHGEGGNMCICTGAVTKGFDIGLLSPSVSVEKIEPPVEVFKPGDVVRSKYSNGMHVWTLGLSGALYHPSGAWVQRTEDSNQFTSENYEKVDIG